MIVGESPKSGRSLTMGIPTVSDGEFLDGVVLKMTLRLGAVTYGVCGVSRRPM